MKLFGLNSNKEEIISKAIMVFIIRVIGYGCGFLFIWIIANKYGAKIQGIFSIAFLFLSIGVMISKLGIETALVKWVASSESIESEKFIFIKSIKIILFSSILTGAIIYFLAPFISNMYNKPDIELSIKYAAFAVPLLALLDVCSNLFAGRKDTTTFGVYYNLGKFLFPLIVIIVFFLFGYLEFEAPILAYLCGLFFIVLLITIHVVYGFNNREQIRNDQFTVKFMLSESYPMLVSSSIVMIMGWSDVFILGFFVSEEKIGIYGTAIKLATVVSFTYNAIATIATPKIASFFSENNMNKLNETVHFSSNVMLIVGTPIFLILFVFPDFFLGLFGQEYIAGKNVLRILLVAQLTNVLTGLVGPILNMTDRHKLLQKFITISLIFNIIFSLLLVKKFELEGVAIASGLGIILWNILGAFYIYKHMKLKTWVTFKKKLKH